MADDLDDAIKKFDATANRIADRLIELREAVLPILIAYRASDNPGNSDLDNEQPYHLTVTLGDLRKLARIFMRKT